MRIDLALRKVANPWNRIIIALILHPKQNTCMECSGFSSYGREVALFSIWKN